MKKNPINIYRSMSEVAKATLWFMVCSLIQKGLTFITTFIFTRLMNESQYGLFCVYNSWLQIITIFATFRLDYSVFNKGMSKFPDDRDEYASSMLGLTTVINTVLLILYLIFRNQVNQFTELSTFVMICIFIELYFIPAASFWSLKERYMFRYKPVVFVTLAMTVLNVGIGVVAVLCSEDKGLARIVSCVVAQILVGGIIYIVLMVRGKCFMKKEYVVFAILFNIPLIPHYFSSYIVDQSDKIMIQKLVSFEATALYSIAYTVGGLVKIFTSSLSNTLIPLQYRQLEKEDFYELNKHIQSVMLIILGLIAMLSIVAPDVVYIVGGKKYVEAVYVMPPVIASVYFSFLYILLANIEFYYEKNKFATVISGIGAVVNLILNYLMIPIWGYIAAAYSTLICYMIFAFGHMWYVRRITKDKSAKPILNNWKLTIMGIIGIVISISLSVLYPYRVVRWIIIVIVAIIALINRNRIIEEVQKFRQK